MIAPRRYVAAAMTSAALLTAGCLEAASPQRQPESATDGVQATGRLAGQRVAISDGEPLVRGGDCDGDGRGDDELCIRARTIDGAEVELVIQNPELLAPGPRIPVADDACRGAACEQVSSGAVVDVASGGASQRALGGTVSVARGDVRLAGEFDLSLPGSDRLFGSLDVRLP